MSLVYGIMNDYVKGLDTFPKTLQDAFALLTETRGRRVAKSVLEGSSFAQGQVEGGGFTPACWGCQEEGVVLSECTKPACMERWRKKQAKRAANGVGLAQVEANWHDCDEEVNWDEAEDFNLLDLKSFLMNQVGFSGTKHHVDISCYPSVNGELILKSVGWVKPEGPATASSYCNPVIGNPINQDCLKPMESFTAHSLSSQ